MNPFPLITSVFRSLAVVLFVLPATALAATYYVDAVNGDDSYSVQQAKNAATPWKTIKAATLAAVAGDTILVRPGAYTESVESKRDGSLIAPITFKASGAVTVQPPSGTPGFYISHNHTIIDGFKVTGGTIGLRLGPHDGGDGPVAGLIARNNTVTGNSSSGIQFVNAIDGAAEFNTASQNGQNGISYSGDSSLIHANTANSNGQIGIYVKNGIDHQVWDNAASGNAGGNIKINGVTVPPPGSAPIGQRTFYIAVNGVDTRTELQAQSAATPWKTIARGLQSAVAGETVTILPGVYAVSVTSTKDGTANAPITIRAVTPGTVTIQPPSGSPGFYVRHNYNVIDGVDVVGGTVGVQIGPHKVANGTVTGLTVRNVFVSGATNIGVKFTNAIDGTVMHSIIRDSGKDGIRYSGTDANIFNNLLVNNGRTAEFAITIASGSEHQITNNTLYSNVKGGIRLGISNTDPVFSTVLNNIIAQNPIGVKEPAGSDYTGHATFDYNDVYGNTTNYSFSKGSGTVKGLHALSVSPAFIDPTNNDFRLSRKATGQSIDSPLINKGSNTAENLGLSGWTAFTDKSPDTDQVDLGYHGSRLSLAEGITTINQAALIFNQSGQSFTLAANLRPGTKSDGIEPGTEFVQISFGGYQYLLPVANFTKSGSTWVYNGGNGVSSASLEELVNGSVNVTLQVSGLTLQTTISTSMGISVQIGDDFASALVNFQGVLQYP